jgi:hypothetical protein
MNKRPANNGNLSKWNSITKESEKERLTKEDISWAKKLPNSNWKVWATRHYKNKPEDFTSEIKQKIEHYAGSFHIPEISKIRFEKHHDLHFGLQMLENAEKQYNDRIKNNLNVVKPSKNTKKFLQGVEKSNRHWFNLSKGSCKNEGKAMGHCGNVPSKVKGDKILSFRTEHKIGDKTYHEPHLTFIYNNGFLGEMKGKGNKKPAPHYHREIANLLKNPRIKGIIGGGYEAKNNFHFTDLSSELQKEVLKANPNLITMDGSEEDLHKILYGNVTFPEKHQDVLKEIARNPNINPKFHERLVGDKDWEVREAIAFNPNLDLKLHEKLANDVRWSIREALASNPNLDPKHHEKLINDENWEVRKAIASNPNLDPKHHEKLVNDESWRVREVMAFNPNLDPKLYEMLVEDKDWRVRYAIASNLNPKLHEKLVNDPCWLVRAAMASNSNLNPKLHERLVEDEDWRVRAGIASNPNLDLKLQEKLVGDKKNNVRITIASNPNLDPKCHEKLANDEDEDVRAAIASNPNLDSKLQGKLVGDEFWGVRKAIALNPNLDPKLYNILLKDNESNVREAIKNNPSYIKWKKEQKKNLRII